MFLLLVLWLVVWLVFYKTRNLRILREIPTSIDDIQLPTTNPSRLLSSILSVGGKQNLHKAVNSTG